MTKTNTLAESVRRALWLSVAGTAAFTANAFAQEPAKDETKTLDSVTVTGSRIPRTQTETASPVVTIDRAAIDKTGALTIGDFIQDVPSMAGAATNPSVNNGGGDGATTVSLRGVTEFRTLLLINGRRIVTRDVNAIPMSMVSKIEILKDGASAIYGSDAIGGVINFILKKQFDGVEVTGNYGISAQDDGERYGLSSTLGISGERGNIIISANYNDQKQVNSFDRDYSTFALSLSSGAVSVGGSSRTTTGRYAVAESVAGLDCNGSGGFVDAQGNPETAALTRIDGRPGTAIGDFRCFASSDLFNYQAVGNLQLTPQERTGVFVAGNYDFTDSVSGYFEGFLNKTRSAGQIAPLPFDGRPGQDSIALSANSIFNPFGVNITDSRLRLSRIGNRRFDFSTETSQFTGGLKGAFGDTSWQWDSNVSFGKIEQASSTTGYLLTSALAAALGPSFRDAGGVARCGTAAATIANCTPVDFFGAPPDGSTAAGAAQLDALRAISVNTTNDTNQTYRGFQANFNGDLFEIGAGTVKGAFGVEYRKDKLDFAPDTLATLPSNTVDFTCLISSEACTTATNGDDKVKELYGEVLLPLIADKLEMTFGLRWSDYDSVGSSTNGKLGIQWRPMEQLLVRGTYAQVFRAPTITNRFGGRFAASDGYTDVCNGITQLQNPALPFNATTNPYVNSTNPACAGVLANGAFSQSDTQLSAIKGGTSNLKAEDGTVVNIGFVYEPSWLEGFSATIDVWNIKLDNFIATYGTQNILNECFNSTTAAPSPFCSLFSRGGPPGEILRLFDFNANIGELDTKGVDFGFRYKFNTAIGDFRTNLEGTYLDKYDIVTIINGQVASTRQNAGSFLSPANGGDGNYSKWRALGTIGWNLGNWDAQWTMRFVDGFKVGSANPNTGTRTCADLAGYTINTTTNQRQVTPRCEFTRGANTYHNLQVGYKYEPWNSTFRLGVDNVFDKQPPILYQNNTLNGNTDERTFDTVGRYFWMSASVNFN
jgi:iron complex outermembrane recepter protein